MPLTVQQTQLAETINMHVRQVLAHGGGDAPLPERPADILKVWPVREPVRRLRPDACNPLIAALARAHCR